MDFVYQVNLIYIQYMQYMRYIQYMQYIQYMHCIRYIGYIQYSILRRRLLNYWYFVLFVAFSIAFLMDLY